MTSRVTMPTEWFGVASTALIFLTMAQNTHSSPYGLALSDCEEDHECAENMFCYNMRTCVKCTNCAVYYRKPNARKMCAREPSECGKCLDGYEAEILTDGNERDYCRVVGEDTTELIPGAASSITSTMLIVGGCIVAFTAALAASFIIHRWRKMRYRGGDQAAQNTEESHHAGSGNGLSPLLGNVNERKLSLGEQTSCIIPSAPPQPPPYESSVPPLRDEATLERKLYLGEQTSCIRPSAPPQPPPYESSVPPLRDEATRVMEHMVKCREAVCLREPGLDVSSFPIEDPDDESNDGSDIDVGSNPDINAESGYPTAYHDEDTSPASAYGNDETVEQSAINFQSSAEGPSLLGVFQNTGINNSDMNDSGLSQDSLSSLSDRSETGHADDCRSEHHAMKRSRWPGEDEGTTLDVPEATSDGMLCCITVPNTDHEAQQAGTSSMSQASSSVSLTSNTAGEHCASEGPVVKRQKFDSGNSSTAEDPQDDEETLGSHECPRISVQAITVLNIQNVVNYNMSNTFNTT